MEYLIYATVVYLVSLVVFLIAWHRMFKFLEIDLTDEEIELINQTMRAEK